MWIMAFLDEARSKTAWPTLAFYRVRQWLRSARVPIAVWWRREREREQLRRYTESELRDLPGELRVTARFERRKRFWES